MKKLIVSLIVVLALCASSVQAEIYVGDHSFEDQSMSEVIYNYIESPWLSSGEAWASLEGEYGVTNVPDGTQYATPSNGTLYQDLAATYEDGVGYTLIALASGRAGASGDFDKWQIALHDTAGTELAATTGTFDLAAGTWDEISVHYTATAADDGKPIRIYFSNSDIGGNHWKFVLDDVHLVKDCLPVGTIVELNDPMQVREDDVNGTAVQFTVELNNNPAIQAGDIITVTVDPNEGGINPDLTIETSAIAATNGAIDLTFTDTTWNIPQTITVKAVDDLIQDDAYAEIHLIAFSTRSALGDPNYGGTDGTDPNGFGGCFVPVAVSIIDNETPAFVISKTSALVSEDGTVDSYTIALQSDPVSGNPVTVDISVDCQATVNGAATAALTFGVGDLGPKTVNVAAVDDSMVEASPHAAAISHVVTTTDTGYAAATIPDVDVSIDDNDARVWNFGDDVDLTSLVLSNPSFELPALADGGIADFNSENPADGYENYGEVSIVNPDLTAGEWDNRYDAGHRAVPDGQQVLTMNDSEENWTWVYSAASACDYVVEDGPVSYTFKASIGVPREDDGQGGYALHPDANVQLILEFNPPDTWQLQHALTYADLVAYEGQWIEIEGCIDLPAGHESVGGMFEVLVTGEHVDVDNLRISVGNHPCEGCYLEITPAEGDIDGDCDVDLEDLAIMAANFLRCYLYPECVTSW